MKPYITIYGYVYNFGVKASSPGNDLLTKLETYEGHTFYVDEPKAVHGLGRAPNPIEMFLSSLASCFIITLKLHSARVKLSIDSVEALAEGSFDIRGFIMPQKFRSGFTSISLKSRIETKASCAELTALLEKVINGWVVGSTISNAIPINFKVDATCLDEEGNLRGLNLSKIVKST
ncbi:MAG: OsmC family protein [Sulfolobales archaeon]